MHRIDCLMKEVVMDRPDWDVVMQRCGGGLLGFLGRPASESGRLCQGDGAHGRGARRRVPRLQLPS